MVSRSAIAGGPRAPTVDLGHHTGGVWHDEGLGGHNDETIFACGGGGHFASGAGRDDDKPRGTIAETLTPECCKFHCRAHVQSSKNCIIVADLCLYSISQLRQPHRKGSVLTTLSNCLFPRDDHEHSWCIWRWFRERGCDGIVDPNHSGRRIPMWRLRCKEYHQGGGSR